jgi:hypothetical protein
MIRVNLKRRTVKEVIIGVVAIVLLAFALYQEPTIVNPMGSDTAHSHGPHNASLSPSNANPVSKDNLPSLTKDQVQVGAQNKGVAGNSHLDQLSPEMKQSLRETLLFNAPIETVERPDGSVIMNTNGRVTHMPVAVQMPDGSIQIKEYSYIPDDK